ncbi:MAG TPA: PrsW family intramembrane metalloprotease, partial [Polyangiaceae bacterium]|nr:PrsW family intramembrane metalloprotease [Polyangiaceae bacterium]
MTSRPSGDFGGSIPPPWGSLPPPWTQGSIPPPEVPLGNADPDKRRRRVGGVLFALAVVVGIALNVLFFTTEIFGSGKDPERMASAMLFGAVPAFVMLLFYLPAPAVLDRFDPEPWWCLLMAFVWGAVVATGVSGFLTGVATDALRGHVVGGAGHVVARSVVAPVVEELAKGAFIWGFFYFMRREFDGTVDGIVYAIVCALGFAAVENVTYYARAVLVGDDVFASTFFFR